MAERNYSIMLSNDGSGNFTPVARRAPTTEPSGGTSLSCGFNEENVNGSYSTTQTALLGEAVMKAMRAVLNDRAAGN